MHPDSDRLFALDESLRAEGRRVLDASGLGALIDEHGFIPVGSQAMHTMTWRDLDSERVQDPPDWEEHCELTRRAAMTGWCVRLHCVNNYREHPDEGGFYLGLRAADPACTAPAPKGHPDVWKLDLWTARAHEFITGPRERWDALMTEEKRAAILATKEAVCHRPEYRDTMRSVHIYEAVLEREIEDLDGFMAWWADKTKPAES